MLNAKPLQSFIILITLGLIWGTGYSIARFAMTNGVSPLGYSFWQSLGPALIITVLLLLKRELTVLTFRHSRFYLICAVTGIALPNTCMYFSAQHLPASIMAIIVNTVPIVAYPMALLYGIEAYNFKRMIGIVLAFVGLLCIIVPASSLPEPHMIPWVLLTLMTPFSFAFCSIYISRNRPSNSSNMLLTAGMLSFSSVIILPLVLGTNSFYVLSPPLHAPDWIILLEIILSSIGYLLFFQLIKIAGPVYYSLVDSIVVITGVAWGVILFNEQLNHWSFLALTCILSALYLVTRQQK